MKLRVQSLLSITMIVAVLFVSCKKESSEQTAPVSDEEAFTVSEENTTAEAEYDDIIEIGLSLGADLEIAAETTNGIVPVTANGAAGLRVDVDFFLNLRHKLGSCTEITVAPNDGTFPKTVTIDFGDGCLCRDGKFRKGAVILYYTAPVRSAGAVLTVTLRNYFVNKVHIEGVKTITNLSAGGAVSYATQVEGGKVTWPSGRGFAFASLKVVTQVRGMDTPEFSDDAFSVEGRSKITYNGGQLTVTRNTETPLIKPVACSWIVEGVLKVKINNRELFIDYGSSHCDNKATLSWAGGERIITLP